MTSLKMYEVMNSKV